MPEQVQYNFLLLMLEAHAKDLLSLACADTGNAGNTVDTAAAQEDGRTPMVQVKQVSINVFRSLR